MVRAINFLYSPNLNPDIFKGTNSLSFIILSLPSFILSIFAHNSSTISIPVAKQPIILDGLRNDTEWDDAFKFNFTSPRLHEGYVILYLKYELFDKALSGAFYIPDKTPFFNQTSPDQIGFNFDTLHTAYETTEIIVSRHALTFEEVIPILSTLFGVISAGFAALSFIPRIKRYIDEKKEREIIYKSINEINDIYYQSSSKKIQNKQ